jgi:hypothetical protein
LQVRVQVKAKALMGKSAKMRKPSTSQQVLVDPPANWSRRSREAKFGIHNHKFLISENLWYRPFSTPSGGSTPSNLRYFEEEKRC